MKTILVKVGDKEVATVDKDTARAIMLTNIKKSEKSLKVLAKK